MASAVDVIRPRGAVIDLRSDLLARGTPAMEEAAARAASEPFSFGLREDRHQVLLERRLASLLGQEDALVFPTCTMANLAAMLISGRPGTRALTVPQAHVGTSEAGGIAAFAGLLLEPIGPLASQADTAALAAPPLDAWRGAVAASGDAQRSAASLVVLENTHNRSGGMPLDVAYCNAVVGVAHGHGLRAHLDGARLFNAATALGVAPAALASGFDTVSISLNKGFGAPLAAALAADAASIDAALIVRQRLGGGIRPTGPAAAATVAALDGPWPFAETHRLARRLAEGLAQIEGLTIDAQAVFTNIVVVQVDAMHGSVEALLERLAARGLLALAFGLRGVRFVTYRGVGEQDIDDAVAIVRETLSERTSKPQPRQE